MDNFMDKLAKRFNAGELIQANGEAEARENQRLREQAEEYNKIMQEVRRLNLKTVEVSEQVSQMIACGIEQLESYEGRATGSDMLEMQNYKLENMEAQLRGLADELSVLNHHIVSSTDDQDEFISLARKVDTVADETKKDIIGSADRLENELKKLEQLVYQGMNKEEKDDGQEALAVLSQNVSEQAQAQQESAKQIKDMIVNLRLYMDEMQKHIEEYVHKEDVKVYRNVQAVLNEQLGAKTRDLSDQINRVNIEVEKSSGMKGLVMLAVICSAASVALQVLQMMGLL